MLRDWTFLAALGAAIVFWLLLYVLTDPVLHLAWPLSWPWQFLWPVLFYPLLEEVVFRGLIQEEVRARLTPWAWGPFSHANLLTSGLFTALHFFSHPAVWALGVLLPSLVFGYFKDKYHSLAAPILLHVFYNAGYFWLFVTPPK